MGILQKSIRFELLNLLGEGSQGCVYKALRRDLSSGLRQIVAIKILHSKTAVCQWRQEFESLAKVRSKYCVQVLSFERIRRRPALVLEYIEGVSLAQLGQTCMLEEDEIGELTAQLERGLKDLHQHQVFHGDLSPQNVLLDTDGRVRLLDFGLANSSSDHSRVTPRFAAPERLSGKLATEASDLFALGRVQEYLRGREAKASPYLQIDPGLRQFQDLRLCPTIQSRLADRVKALLARRKIGAEMETQTQNPRGQKAWSKRGFVLGGITSFLVLATSSATQSIYPRNVAMLTVRTQKWHYFLLNGRPIGYSPFSLPIEPGQTYRLEWISAKTRGETAFSLKALEIRTLEDSDFSH